MESTHTFPSWERRQHASGLGDAEPVTGTTPGRLSLERRPAELEKSLLLAVQAASMQTTAEMARSMLDEMLGFVEEYLEAGGPLSILEDQPEPVAGQRVEFHGRPMFPERLHVVALAIDVTTRLLKTLDDFFAESSAEVAAWSSATEHSLTPATRERLEQIRTRSATR